MNNHTKQQQKKNGFVCSSIELIKCESDGRLERPNLGAARYRVSISEEKDASPRIDKGNCRRV